MNALLQKLLDSANDAGDFAQSLGSAGLQSVNGLFEGIRVFGSLSALEDKEIERDETHYVLVPLVDPLGEYAVYTKRVLPPDVGATNSLPKARIFHLPDSSGREVLESRLVNAAVDVALGDQPVESDFADALENFANQVDKETMKISGGLILIGGAVAFANPLLGVGIAVKGLLPSIGSKASKAGVGYVSDKIRKWNSSAAISREEKKALKEVRQLKPEIYENPLIRSLEAVITNPNDEYDPAFDHRIWVDEFESHRTYSLTIEALRQVYGEAFKRSKESHLKWIHSLIAQ